MGRIETNFKQTEVGLIPVDWEVKTISDCCKIFGRIGFRGYTINDIVEEGFGSITISPSNIIDGKVNFDKCTYLSWFKYEESPEIKIFNGDILLVKTGSTFGKTAIVKGLNLKATINPQIVVLKNIEINRILLGYIMGFNDVQNYIKSSVVGGAIPTLSQKQILNFKIFVPPTKTEQTLIANALSDADVYIESLEKLIDKKQKIKQGAMQQLLKPKPHWELKKLGEVAEYKNGKTLEKFVVEDGEFFLITLNSIDIKGSLKTNHLTINRSDNFLERGDLVMVLSDVAHGNFLGLTDVIPEKNKYALNQRMGALKNLKEVLPKFLSYYINLHQAYFKSCGKGSSQQNLGKEDILSFDVYLPDRLEQECILNILSDMDNEIATLTQKLTKAKAIKQGMMQQLLTGKIRLI